MIRLPVWSTYLEVLNNSTFIREFVIKSEGKGGRKPRFGATYGAPTEEEKRFQNLRYLVSASAQDMRDGRFHEAKHRYQRAIVVIDSLPEDSLPADGHTLLAQALNNLAWLEATCASTQFRSPKDAVRHATAVARPCSSSRRGKLLEYIDRSSPLPRSASGRMQRTPSPVRWHFAAKVTALPTGSSSRLVELKLGQKAKAHEWYERAVERFQRSAPLDAELYRFQVEAAQELGLPRPGPPEVGANGPLPRSLQPGTIPRPLRRRNAEESLKLRQE